LENREIARVLWETADLMEIAAEDGFRIRSYRNGATAIEGYPERIADILRNAERNVTEVPGIGKGLAHVLAEIIESGSCERRDLLLQKFPPGALEFLKIQGLGPKSIALIFEHFHIGTIDELERLCQEQKLRDLPRMGAKLEEKVLRSIAQYRQRTGRYLLSPASKRLRPPEACGAGAKPLAISIFWSLVHPPRRRSIRLSPIREWKKCSGMARIKPARKSGAKACRWTCAHFRPAVSAQPCSISPAVKTTTWRSGFAP
jgi:hypothetical protein